MSTKPTIALARFADQGGSDVLTPSSGLRDSGFVSGTAIVQSYVNELFHQGYLWDKWLDDGDVAFHNLSTTGTLTVATQSGFGGAATFSSSAAIAGLLTANGGITVPTGQAVTLSGSTSLSVTANVTIAGQLAMSGVATYGGTMRLQASSVTMPATGNNNDYALPTNPILTWTGGSGSPVVTGMVAVGDGHVITIVNSGSVSIQFTHQDSNSSASNRIILPGATTLTVAPDQIVRFLYGTGGLGRWRMLSKNF